MDAKREKILDRLRKLAELSKSANVNEAANAAAAMQSLMSQHAIEEAMLTTVTAEEEIETDILDGNDGKKKSATWRWWLADALCYVNNAKGYSSGPTIKMIGRPSDIATAQYIFAHVAREIERLCKDAAETRGNPGRTWCNNFKLGAAEVVGKRLREAHRETIAKMRKEADAGDTLGNGVALMRINNGLAKLDYLRKDVEKYGKEKLRLRVGSASSCRINSDGREQGRKAGERVNLAPAKGGALRAGARGTLGTG